MACRLDIRSHRKGCTKETNVFVLLKTLSIRAPKDDLFCGFGKMF
eukprot:UN23375